MPRDADTQIGQEETAFHADSDNDTILVECQKANSKANSSGPSRLTSLRHQQPWRGLIGKAFGWGWLTLNQQGYCDGALLSFGDLNPRILLQVIASSIVCSAVIREEHVLRSVAGQSRNGNSKAMKRRPKRTRSA